MLLAERLHALLTYDPITGYFSWRTARQGVRVGARAGCVSGAYRYIMIDYVKYAEHNLAALYMTGEWPDDEMDHENTFGTDNSWTNLRPATRAQNMWNRKVKIDSTLGLKGVSPRHDKFQASIKANGQYYYLGLHNTPEQAHGAYCEKAQELHGVFSNEG